LNSSAFDIRLERKIHQMGSMHRQVRKISAMKHSAFVMRSVRSFWTYLKNTMIIIVPSVIFGTITATMCGYAFARMRFRLRNFLFTLCVGSMLLPTMVTLIPLYIMWTKFFNMSNTFWPLILPYLCGGGAFNIFLIRQFVRSIPRELDEAATIDGAGYFRILLNVIVPSIKSAMIVDDHVPLHPDLERSAPADDLYQYGR